MSYLPHRNPFLFVDSIYKVDLIEGHNGSISKINSKSFVGSLAAGDFKVNEDLEILKGHFPGNPILPGVVQVEMSAQVCPFIFVKAFESSMEEYSLDVALLGVEKARFRKPVLPGMDLRFQAKLTKARGDYMTFDCEVECEGKSISSAEVFASLKFVRKGE